MRIPRFVAGVAALVTVLGTASSVSRAHAAGVLRFVAPASRAIAGTTDLRVDAPPGTTAVRFSLDGIQLSELTDLYARQTKTNPVWATATDAGWFPSGAHTLRAEADTPDGMLVATEPVVTSAPADGPGVVALDGGWRF